MRAETWLEELSHELTARGVAPSQVAEIVVELHCHLEAERCSPMGAFGSPASYAAQVVASIGEAGPDAGVDRRARPASRSRACRCPSAGARSCGMSAWTSGPVRWSS